MFCSKCGNQIKDGTDFCAYCGKAIKQHDCKGDGSEKDKKEVENMGAILNIIARLNFVVSACLIILAIMWGYGFVCACADINSGSFIRAGCKYISGSGMNPITRHGYVIGTKIFARSRYGINL